MQYSHMRYLDNVDEYPPPSNISDEVKIEKCEEKLELLKTQSVIFEHINTLLMSRKDQFPYDDYEEDSNDKDAQMQMIDMIINIKTNEEKIKWLEAKIVALKHAKVISISKEKELP